MAQAVEDTSIGSFRYMEGKLCNVRTAILSDAEAIALRDPNYAGYIARRHVDEAVTNVANRFLSLMNE